MIVHILPYKLHTNFGTLRRKGLNLYNMQHQNNQCYYDTSNIKDDIVDNRYKLIILCTHRPHSYVQATCNLSVVCVINLSYFTIDHHTLPVPKVKFSKVISNLPKDIPQGNFTYLSISTKKNCCCIKCLANQVLPGMT